MRYTWVGLLAAAALFGQRGGPKAGTYSTIEVRSVPQPDLPKVINDLGPGGGREHARGPAAFQAMCAPPPKDTTTSSRARMAGTNTKGPGRPIENPGDDPKDPAFVHDAPPTGGDGSFKLSLGGRAVQMGSGTGSFLATHSHREPHLFWVIDRRGNRYVRRSIVLPPDSVIEVHLEKFKPGDRDFSGAGIVRMEQTTVPGYGDRALKDHPLECNRDYVWKVTGEGRTLAPPGGTSFTHVQASMDGATQLKMARIKVWRGSNTSGPPAKVYELHSGCANFQICGRFNGCTPIQPQPNCAFNAWREEEAIE